MTYPFVDVCCSNCCKVQCLLPCLWDPPVGGPAAVTTFTIIHQRCVLNCSDSDQFTVHLYINILVNSTIITFCIWLIYKCYVR